MRTSDCRARVACVDAENCNYDSAVEVNTGEPALEIRKNRKTGCLAAAI
jgi:hypothetical protein